MISFNTVNPISSGDNLTADEVAGIKAAGTPITGVNPVLDLESGNSLLNSIATYLTVRNYSTISSLSAETLLIVNILYYCLETATAYRYVSNGSAYIVDSLFACNTSEGGNTRFVGTFGRYIADGTSPHEVIVSASGNLSASQCRGTIVSNYGQIENNLQHLPDATSGLAFVAMAITVGSGTFNFQAGSSDKIYLNGVAGADNGTVGLATPAAGDSARFVAFQTGASSWDWFVDTGVGVWAVV